MTRQSASVVARRCQDIRITSKLLIASHLEIFRSLHALTTVSQAIYLRGWYETLSSESQSRLTQEICQQSQF